MFLRRGGLVILSLYLCAFAASSVADDLDAKAVVAKAIKAMGGNENLKKATAMTWKGKGSISFGDNDSEFVSQVKVRGLNHYQSEFEGEFGGNKIRGVTVINGDKGWRKFGEMVLPLDATELANEKRAVYLLVVPVTLVSLLEKEFKLEGKGEEQVGEKTVVTLKVTGPDGKDFTLSFDKESGLPMRLTATVNGFMGDEFVQETTFGKYQDFDGLKRATKIRNKRDGKTFISQDITEFKVLEKLPDETFAEPK